MIGTLAKPPEEESFSVGDEVVYINDDNETEGGTIHYLADLVVVIEVNQFLYKTAFTECLIHNIG